MLDHDPITAASASLQAAVGDVLKGGDPNRLKGPYCALLRARGQGKLAKQIEALPPLPYVKPRPKK